MTNEMLLFVDVMADENTTTTRTTEWRLKLRKDWKMQKKEPGENKLAGMNEWRVNIMAEVSAAVRPSEWCLKLR